MTMLSDGTLLCRLVEKRGVTIVPLDREAIQPSSVDVRLGEHLRLFTEGDEIIDPRQRQELTVPTRIPEQGFIVNPGEFLLGETAETVTIGAGFAAQFTGKSSLARLGLQVHQTAGHIDPGFEGVITLEIKNVNSRPFRLHRDMWIGQLLVFELDADAVAPYGAPGRNNRYQGQSIVTESRSWM